eukprot:GHRR01024974.1.p1 GENE.GHRR01024974.1~~GHRR01024974.1.p1  ORF type:complete len:189 (-),score=47.47 GHRR01024974.1:436-1002(-)
MMRPLSSSKVAHILGLSMPNTAALASTVVADSEPMFASDDESQDFDSLSLASNGIDNGLLLLGAASTSSSGPPWRHSSTGHGDSRKQSLISSPDVFNGLDLGLADSSAVTLEVGIVEVANLSPRSGWSRDLTHALLNSASADNAHAPGSSAFILSEAVKRKDLPLPIVYVFCGSGGPGDRGFEVGLAL